MPKQLPGSKSWSQVVSVALRAHARPACAVAQAKYFQTQPGQYGHGDKFLGVTNPVVNRIEKENRSSATLPQQLKLLRSPFNEERLLALKSMANSMSICVKAKDKEAAHRLHKEYLRSVRKFVNNWNLVDASSYFILGPFLLHFADDATAGRCFDELCQQSSLW